MNRLWTEQDDQKLAALWQDGLSASKIATRMGMGLSRNAVIGRVHRIGLPARRSPIRSRVLWRAKQVFSTPMPPRARQTVSPQKTARRSGKDKTLPLPQSALLEPLNGVGVRPIDLQPPHCRFTADDPRDPAMRFCGHTVVPGASWCPHHLIVVSEKKNHRRSHPEAA